MIVIQIALAKRAGISQWHQQRDAHPILPAFMRVLARHVFKYRTLAGIPVRFASRAEPSGDPELVDFTSRL